MRFLSVFLCLSLAPLSLQADPVARALNGQVLPGFAALEGSSATLRDVSLDHCAPDDPALRDAFNAAWDSWIKVSHLRFGPTETDNRAFALGYWPDTRGAVLKTLRGLVSAQDDAIHDPAEFAQVSIAARGFTALEYLIYDPEFTESGAYGCALVQAISADIADISHRISSDWQGGFSDSFAADPEALATLYGAAVTGLQFTAEARLGRPLGTIERPRPTRAEARRAGRSLAHVALSLEATRAMALLLADDDPSARDILEQAFERAQSRAEGLDDPVFAGVADPLGRLKVEILLEDTNGALAAVRGTLGPSLGVAEGFNALDGD